MLRAGVGEGGNVVRGEHLRREDDMMRISTGEQCAKNMLCCGGNVMRGV